MDTDYIDDHPYIMEVYNGSSLMYTSNSPEADHVHMGRPARRHSDTDIYSRTYHPTADGHFILYNGNGVSDNTSHSFQGTRQSVSPEQFYFNGVPIPDDSFTLDATSVRRTVHDRNRRSDSRDKPEHRRRYSDPLQGRARYDEIVPKLPDEEGSLFLESTRGSEPIVIPYKDYPLKDSRSHEYAPVYVIGHPGAYISIDFDHQGIDPFPVKSEPLILDPDGDDVIVLPDGSTYLYPDGPDILTETTTWQDSDPRHWHGQPEPEQYMPRSWGRFDPLQPHYHDNGHVVSNGSHDRHRRRHRDKKPGGRGSETGCHNFLRYATTLFTFIVFLAGAGTLGLGIYLIGSDYGANEMSSVLGNVLYQVVTYVLIICGASLVFISMCGCCGALRESKCMLLIFIGLVSIIVLALITAVVIVFVFRSKLENNIVRSMEDVLVKKYGVDLVDHTDNKMVTDTMNWLQKELECCGVTGGPNSTTSWAIYRHSAWYKGFETGKPYVPQSCCVPDGDLNICTGITSINGPPSQGPPLNSDMDNNEHLYKDGCYDEVIHYIQSHLVMIGVASIGTVLVMLFGLFFSIYLYRRIDLDGY